MTRVAFRNILLTVLVLFVLMWTLLPFLWLVKSSLSPRADLLSVPPVWIPHGLSFEHFVRLLTGTGAGSGAVENFRDALRNSFVVALLTSCFCIGAGSLAAYAFARLPVPGRKPLFLSLLVAEMVPSISLLVPLYMMTTRVQLFDTYAVVVILHSTFILPFVTWFLTGYFRSLPRDLEEAALIDGCSRMQALLRVVAPVSLPGLSAAAIFSFLESWNEFLFALNFTTSYNAKTLPVALAEFVGKQRLDYGLMCTGGVVAALPPVLFALLFQRFIIRGLTAGAVKG